MCGRYTLVQWEALPERFGVVLPQRLTPRYNIAPTQHVPVILRDGDSVVCKLLRWGLVPFWAKDLSVGNRLINARGETVQEKNSFKHSFRQKRCLVPADGFFEWKSEAGGKKAYLFSDKNGALFAFAGLWDTWQAPGGETVCSFTIITTAANTLVAPVHHRMPVILEQESERTWLDGDEEPLNLNRLLQPYPAERMACRTVSQLVNSPRNDSPEVLRTDEL